MKRTYQPSKRVRKRRHGFLQRSHDAPHILLNRRRKKRAILSA